MNEEWRPFPEFPDYELSSDGRVRRITGGKGARIGRILHTFQHPDGYRRACLRRDGRYYHVRLHVYVALAFIGPRPGGLEINHKDADKGNPRAANLEYVTHAANMAHAKEFNRYPRGEAKRNVRLTDDIVRAIRAEASGGEWGSLTRIGAKYGLNRAYVWQVVNRVVWSHVP